MTKNARMWRNCLLLTTAAAGLATGAMAQEAPEQPNDGPDEIVVTATRQEQTISKVPLSITAFSKEKLDVQGVRQVDDIARLTPGVTFTRGDARNGAAATISIRGIASTAGSATTGIYIDDTPIQVRSIGFSAFNPFPAVFDLERVEVLRGPQGTLFGAGSEGGTIRFLTPRPDLEESHLYGRSEIATTQDGAPSYEAGLAVGVPIVTDRLAIRASAYYRHDGGYIDRVDFHRTTRRPTTIVDKNANSQATLVFNASAAWKPTETLTITPSIYYQKLKTHDGNAYWEALSDPGAGKFRTGNAVANTSKDRFILPALKAELEIGGRHPGVQHVLLRSRPERRERLYSVRGGAVGEQPLLSRGHPC